jgi:Asp-tRNA(Asn)/Glu-tRNA(Gln) amidotransferase A subunit family amidase
LFDAFLLPTPEKAREQATAAEREIMAGAYRGPLHGIPFGLKDIYATAGIRTTSHSKICENLGSERRRDHRHQALPGRWCAAGQARDP